MIILLLSVPEFYIISSNGIQGEHIHAKNTCPQNSSYVYEMYLITHKTANCWNPPNRFSKV